jgi:copper chaperone
MKTLQFKTNIKCDGCLAKVSPFLNGLEDIRKWDVNILTPEKILTVETASLSSGEIQAAVREAGFTAEEVK